MRIFGIGAPSWNDVMREHQKLLRGFGQFTLMEKKNATPELVHSLKRLLKDALYLKANRRLGTADEEKLDGVIKETKLALKKVA